MFFLNMVDLWTTLCSSLSKLSTLTWDTFLTLRGPWGFYLNHVLPPRPSKSYVWVGGPLDFSDSPSAWIWDLDWTLALGLSTFVFFLEGNKTMAMLTCIYQLLSSLIKWIVTVRLIIFSIVHSIGGQNICVFAFKVVFDKPKTQSQYQVKSKKGKLASGISLGPPPPTNPPHPTTLIGSTIFK